MRLAWIGLAALAACGGRTQLGGTLGDSGADTVLPQPQAQGIALPDCAPNDGLAYTFELGGTVTPKCPSGSITAGSVRISMWSPILSGPGTYPIGDGTFASGSMAFVCATGPSDCTTASHGTLVLNAFTASAGSPIAGSYTLVLPDGTVVTASFADAVFCDNPLMCG